MKRENQAWSSLQPASINWDNAGQPSSRAYGDVYFSRDNGLQESRHVFLQGNSLPQRWRQHPRSHFCIGETGFGTALNFLLTWQLWRDMPVPRPNLHYLSFEKTPLSRNDLERALALWPTLTELSHALLDAYPGLLPGQHRVLLDNGAVTLDLWWEDVAEALPELASHKKALVDAWYLDGFSPACNRSMWGVEVLRAAAAVSYPDATIATFSVAGTVRKNLSDAGFKIEKTPGYGRKRECLRGVRSGKVNTDIIDTHRLRWDLNNNSKDKPGHVLVIGAGLAGCTVAAALARRGIAVSVLEQEACENAGSGIDRGIVYTRLSCKHSALVDFALQSFQFSTTFYRALFRLGKLRSPNDGDLCGNFQQSKKAGEMAKMRHALAGLESLAQVLSAAQADEILGIEQSCGGYWYPNSGWLRPRSVCKALLEHPKINLIDNAGLVTLRYQNNLWQASGNTTELAHGDCAVVTTGPKTQLIPQFSWLPIQTIRGQVTQLPSIPKLQNLRAAFCHAGYVTPADPSGSYVGATFDLDDQEPAPRDSDHQRNIAQLAAAVPAWRDALISLEPNTLKGTVGYRCASPDYLPIVGAAPNVPELIANFGALRHNAKQSIASPGSYLPGLYISTAHGSRGLASTPLAGELIASLICQEPTPLSRTLCRALSPARFIIRDLCKNRL